MSSVDSKGLSDLVDSRVDVPLFYRLRIKDLLRNQVFHKFKDGISTIYTSCYIKSFNLLSSQYLYYVTMEYAHKCKETRKEKYFKLA